MNPSFFLASPEFRPQFAGLFGFTSTWIYEFWDLEVGKMSANRPWTLLQGLLQQGVIGRCCGAWSKCGETRQRLKCWGLAPLRTLRNGFPVDGLRDMLQEPSIFDAENHGFLWIFS